MIDPLTGEPPGIVIFLVETHNEGHTLAFEVRNVVVGA
jgi:hypothetical protein